MSILERLSDAFWWVSNVTHRASMRLTELHRAWTRPL